MTEAEFASLRQGDGLIVGFGSHGTQIATVLGWTVSGNCYVAKWRQKSKQWTGRVRITAGEVKGRSREFQHAGTTVGRIPELRRNLLHRKA